MSRPRRDKKIEMDLMDAIDRLLARGEDVNHSSVTREAKRARGILSRNTSGYSAVLERIAQVQAKASPARALIPTDRPRSSKREVEALLNENRELRRELANVRSACAALLTARADNDRLEPQLADMQRRQAARADRVALESTVN